MDSDEEGENDRGISLTHLLFGNINSDGELENDFLDPESIRNLHQLRQLGIGTQLREIADDCDSPNYSPTDATYNKECMVKSPSAVDYSDITELAEDSEDSDDSQSEVSSVISTNDSHNTSNGKVEDESYNGESEKYDEDEDESSNSNSDGEATKPSDAILMPPPPLPPPPPKEAAVNLGYDDGSAEQSNEPPESEVSNAANMAAAEKKLDTPLAAMLPSKYKNMDVTKLFPEFRHGQVLRFSRLFGPGKPSSLPQLWRGVKKKKKKNGDESHLKETKKISFDISSSPPPPEDCESDDEMKLMKPEEKNRSGGNNENSKSNENSPGFSAWRYGPASLWYDMLNVPENGEGFDYGFRLRPVC